MSHLIPFKFDAHDVRVEVDDDGLPWWVLSECTEVVGLTDIGKAATRIDTEDRKKSLVLAQDGKQREVWWINESGLYTLLLRSNKPEAKRFQRWVTAEVLPTIRKTGRYEMASPSAATTDLSLDTVIQALAQGQVRLSERVDALERRLEHPAQDALVQQQAEHIQRLTQQNAVLLEQNAALTPPPGWKTVYEWCRELCGPERQSVHMILRNPAHINKWNELDYLDYLASQVMQERALIPRRFLGTTNRLYLYVPYEVFRTALAKYIAQQTERNLRPHIVYANQKIRPRSGKE